ncbi:U11/U12 small nuclear ribonucleoprotein 25 kDa protein isoform X3 [Panicum hallii]|uniref:U11/U12 small nuclear ribonucleoprotein 25 kDa protein isoform X3 n=1 Tax=Panicum hallii TaxID=206008 RepID=UPI000DF4D990|nr:U11/U12 small nuclear ribonucleoprotein 25 kDa protein isoform X3 [Panicum hallii]
MDSGSGKPEEVAAYQSSEAKQARLQSMLAALLEDPILADVSRKPSLADVDTLINLELGSAMRVTVVKLDNTSFDVAVSNAATVKDLKLAIRKKINEIEQEQMGHRHISWGGMVFFLYITRYERVQYGNGEYLYGLEKLNAFTYG